MRVSYNKLWKLLIDKRMSKSELRDAVNMSSNTLAKMGKEETVSMEVIMRICKELKCDVGDIIEILPDEKEYYRIASDEIQRKAQNTDGASDEIRNLQ